MTRLDKLKEEREIVQGLKTLSFGLKDKCDEYFEHEITCIEIYHSDNPVDMVSMVKKQLNIKEGL